VRPSWPAAEAQLARSPVAGRVAEVKIRDVTPEGVTVEVVLVERSKSSGYSGAVGENGANERSQALRAP